MKKVLRKVNWYHLTEDPSHNDPLAWVYLAARNEISVGGIALLVDHTLTISFIFLLSRSLS